MTLAGRVAPTVGINRLAQPRGGGQRVDGASNGKHRKPLPSVLIGGRPQGLSQTPGIPVQLFTGRPGQLGARLGHGTAMDRRRRGPEAATTGLAKASTRVAVYPLAFAADREGEQNEEPHGKGKFPTATKRFRRSGYVLRGKPVRN